MARRPATSSDKATRGQARGRGWVTYHVTYQVFESFVKENLTEADLMTPKLAPGMRG